MDSDERSTGTPDAGEARDALTLAAQQIYKTVGLDEPTLRRGDLAELAGADPTRTIRWWRAMGFPEVGDEAVAFNSLDLDLVSRLTELRTAELIGEDDILRLARLLGASFQRIAEAQLALVDELLANLPDANPDAIGRERLAMLFDGDEAALMSLLESSVTYVWKRHMLAALGRRFSADDESNEMAVGFADLSGFSKLAKQLSATELTEVVDQFESTAFDVVSGGESRVVKLIGDEVMFASPTIRAAVLVGMELRDRLSQVENMAPVHCGIAFGPTVAVGGDVFGNTVNLASRLTSVARPSTVVVPRDQGRLLAEYSDLHVRFMRRSFSLKGVGDTRIAVVDRRPLVTVETPEPKDAESETPEFETPEPEAE